MAVRRRPSYGFSLAGTAFGVSPEAGVSKSTLAQLFPELDFGSVAAATKPEEVEKPEEATPTTPKTGVAAIGSEETVTGSELQRYNVEGKLTYGAPFNIQFGPTGPQGRGSSRLGYSGSVSTGTTTPTQVGESSQTSVALPQYKMPEFDYSPFESLLEQGRGILSSIQEAAKGMTTREQMEPGAASAPAAPAAPAPAAPAAPVYTTKPAWSMTPQKISTTTSQAAAGLVPSTQSRGTYVSPSSPSASSTAQAHVQTATQAVQAGTGLGIRQIAATGTNSSQLGSTGVASILAAPGSNKEAAQQALNQAAKGNITLTPNARAALQQAARR